MLGSDFKVFCWWLGLVCGVNKLIIKVLIRELGMNGKARIKEKSYLLKYLGSNIA